MFSRDKKSHADGIDPDEIFLDSSNLPQFDTHQFEGRLERPIGKTGLAILGLLFSVTILIFLGRLADLGILRGAAFAALAENNRLDHAPIFAERGAVFDRNGTSLAWNEPFSGEDFSARVYRATRGLAHVLGYVSYPARDDAGFYYTERFQGLAGVERSYDAILSGKNGAMIVETDAQGKTEQKTSAIPVESGKNLVLSIDARVEEALFATMEATVKEAGFKGGAGVIMDIHNGEILALASYPEYDPGVLTGGNDALIAAFVTDAREPFLNRAVSGLYTPGSIVKPVLAVAALQEQLIHPDAEILSTGAITIPNPYFPDKESVFRDWKAHGLVDMRAALAVSSDVYFYEIGGGYKDQPGLGIGKIETYMNLFGFGRKTGIDLPGEAIGVIPTPRWKEKIFGDDWRLGDTYITAIGQYGFQVTPLQAVRAVAAVANGGKLLRPRVVKSTFASTETIAEGRETAIKWEQIPVDAPHYDVVREGMRLGVTEGTAKGLDIPGVVVAAKTGTAEIGTVKKFVHSWVTGFFPYENPRYGFAVVLERGPAGNPIGALYVFRTLLEWMREYTPEYLN